jgi:hypothetical protein
MSDLADIAERTQRFNEAVRAFTPASPVHHAKLMPMKDGIMQLRQKGASLRLIRELLATVGLAVSTATITRFLAEVSRNSASARQRQRFAHGRTSVQNTTRGQAAAVLVATVAVTGNSPPTQLPFQTHSPRQMLRRHLNDRALARRTRRQRGCHWGLTERLGSHCALRGSVLLFNWKGALKVTPLSVERM